MTAQLDLLAAAPTVARLDRPPEKSCPHRGCFIGKSGGDDRTFARVARNRETDDAFTRHGLENWTPADPEPDLRMPWRVRP